MIFFFCKKQQDCFRKRTDCIPLCAQFRNQWGKNVSYFLKIFTHPPWLPDFFFLRKEAVSHTEREKKNIQVHCLGKDDHLSIWVRLLLCPRCFHWIFKVGKWKILLSHYRHRVGGWTSCFKIHRDNTTWTATLFPLNTTLSSLII